MESARHRCVERWWAGFRSAPKAHSYPILGATLGLGMPIGLLLATALATGRAPSLAWMGGEIGRQPITYAYLTASTVAALVVCGHLCGRLFDRLLLFSNTDPLTGLLNRRRLGERIAEERARDRRFGHVSCVLCVDIDRLKAINDRGGHQAGDRALVAIGRVLQKNARATDAVARVGGDEFAVLLPETSAAQALALSQRILTDAGRCEGRLAVSIGIAELDAGAQGAVDVPAAADAALYAAKAAGGGRAVIAPPLGSILPVSPWTLAT